MKKLFFSKNIVAILLVAMLSIGMLVACIRTKETEILQPEGVKVTNLNPANKVAYGSRASLQVEFVFEEHDHETEDVEHEYQYDTDATIVWNSNLGQNGSGIVFENTSYNANTHTFVADAVVVVNDDFLEAMQQDPNFDPSDPSWIPSETAATVSVVVTSFGEELTTDIELELVWAPYAIAYVEYFSFFADMIAGDIDFDNIDPDLTVEDIIIIISTMDADEMLQQYPTLYYFNYLGEATTTLVSQQFVELHEVNQYHYEFVNLSTHIQSLARALFNSDFYDAFVLKGEQVSVQMGNIMNNLESDHPNLASANQEAIELITSPFNTLLEDIMTILESGDTLTDEEIAVFDARLEQLMSELSDQIMQYFTPVIDELNNIFATEVAGYTDIANLLDDPNLSILERLMVEMLLSSPYLNLTVTLTLTVTMVYATIMSMLHPELVVPPLEAPISLHNTFGLTA